MTLGGKIVLIGHLDSHKVPKWIHYNLVYFPWVYEKILKRHFIIPLEIHSFDVLLTVEGFQPALQNVLLVFKWVESWKPLYMFSIVFMFINYLVTNQGLEIRRSPSHQH